MVTIDITNALVTAVHQQINQFRTLVQRYHADPDYRGQVEADPVTAFREQGVELPSDIAIRVLANTDDTFYMVLPPDPNMGLGDELLSSVVGGGGTLGTAGSLGTGSSVSTPTSSGSSFGSAGSAGTASISNCV